MGRIEGQHGKTSYRCCIKGNLLLGVGKTNNDYKKSVTVEVSD